MEDFGLQAILEKMNSLLTPLINGPFWDISNIFQNFLIFSQSLSRQQIQLKVTLVVMMSTTIVVTAETAVATAITAVVMALRGRCSSEGLQLSLELQ